MRCSWLLLTLLCGALVSPAQELTVEAPPGHGLAVLVATNYPQRYQGRNYFFLGDAGQQGEATLAPGAGRSLALLWGAKGDDRSAVLTVNGRVWPLRGGGFDGWRWLTVPLPDDLPGSRYEITLRPDNEAKPAFLAEMRLLGPQPASTGAAPALILRAVDLAGSREAFPAQRARWDKAPVLPATRSARELAFRQAEKNSRAVAEALYRCHRYVTGWLAHADPESGLIPRGLNPKNLWQGVPSTDLWNGRDAAADNYAFMVLTCALTDTNLLATRMTDILHTERTRARRLGRLSDNYQFSTRTFLRAEPVLDEIVFDNAEYVKDGLLPITEWLGPSPWSERAIELVEDLWQHAPIETSAGRIPTLEFEVNGDLLQANSRLFWLTGDRKFLDWAVRLGDFYLLGTNHPTRDLQRLHLVDHGCEVVNGLSELYFAVSRVWPEKQRAYGPPLHAIYDAILAQGRNEHGLLYEWFEPGTGAHSQAICDTWGYVLDGFYTLYLVDGTAAYRAAAQQALASLLPHYTGFRWQGGSADGYADAIEGAINLLNRLPDPAAAAWVEAEMRVMWSKQQTNGVIERWHGDGNFARTTIMYALWQSQGVRVEPWREDVRVGAVMHEGTLLVSLTAEAPWTGRLVFDRPRHRDFLHLPLDYPRINQFPEWFTAAAERSYRVTGLAARARTYPGAQLSAGLPVSLPGGREMRLTVR